MSKRASIKIRQATFEDIPQLLQVEKAAWYEGARLSEEQLQSELNIFPEGVFVAELRQDGPSKIVGLCCVMRMHSDNVDKISTWDETTANGYFTTHDPNGDMMFGANLSVLPGLERGGIGDRLFAYGASLLVRWGLPFGVLGERLPKFAEFNTERRRKGLEPFSVEQYLEHRDDRGRIYDPQLRFYRSIPFLKIERIIPGYFPDPGSENYGVLVRWTNPLSYIRCNNVPVLKHLVAMVVRSGI